MEDYLEAIFHLSEADGVARVSQIAKRLGVNKSSVTGALHHLSEHGLINYDPYQYITLTDAGRQVARDVAWRHDVLKRFLIEVLDVEEQKATETACKLEHSMDREVLVKLLRFVQFVHGYHWEGKSLREVFDVVDK